LDSNGILDYHELLLVVRHFLHSEETAEKSSAMLHQIDRIFSDAEKKGVRDRREKDRIGIHKQPSPPKRGGPLGAPRPLRVPHVYGETPTSLNIKSRRYTHTCLTLQYKFPFLTMFGSRQG